MENKIIELAKLNNGYITNKLLRNNNIPTINIYRLVEFGLFKKVAKGIFILNDYIEDEFYIISLKYRNAIFCNETALYLQKMSNRQFGGFNVVVEYNSSIPKYENLKVYRTRKKIDIGVEEIETPFGNLVKSWDKERIICDLFANPNNYEYEDRIYAINEYKKNYFNLKKLYTYAKIFNVYEKIKIVFEVIGWN